MNPHPLKGETVQVTGFSCAIRGNYKEYTAFCAFVGSDSPVSFQVGRGIKFNETVAKVFRTAGHIQVVHRMTYQVTNMNSIDVVLGTKSTRRGDVYTIESVCGLDGETFHHVEQVQRNVIKKVEWTQESVAENRKKYMDPATARRLAMKEAQDAETKTQQNNDWLELARIVSRYYTIATSHDVARIRRFALTMLYLVALRSDYDYIGDGFNDVGLLYDYISAIDVRNSTKGIEL